MEATNKEQEALMECYNRLYANSTPKADFNKLMEEASEDEDGRKVIDFMAYEIDQKEFDRILEEVITEYKISPNYRKQAFRNAIYLGASPKFKGENEQTAEKELS